MTCSSRRTFLTGVTTATLLHVTGCIDTADEGVETGYGLETVVDGLVHPWSIAVVPGSEDVLVTERSGRLNLINLTEGSLDTIDNVPEVHAAGQGGLLDVALYPDFPDEPWVYLTYAATNGDGASATHLARGQLDVEEQRLTDVELLHIAEPFVASDNHFGSRVVFGPDGMVYMTSGDRQFKNFGPEHVSQDTTNDLGATLRLEPDGSIPEDNPFIDDVGAKDTLFSYGHRNAQGMTVHPDTGDIWVSEHGEHDGDMLHILESGGNYGWPIAHYGCEYGTTNPIGDEPHELDDVVDPVYYWECTTGGFPPSGMTFYSGDAFPAWEGDLLVGNLAGAYLGRFTVDGTAVEEVDPLLDEQGWRIRDVEEVPHTGHLLVAVDESDAPLVELVPA